MEAQNKGFGSTWAAAFVMASYGMYATVVSNTTYAKNDTPGYDYPQQPAPTTYYHGNPGQPPYYQPQQAPAGYYPPQNNVMNSNTVVVTQPSPHYTQVVPVQDNMNLAIFACLCCFWPLGLVAILKANDDIAVNIRIFQLIVDFLAKDAIARGDLESARRNGSDARKFSLIAIGVGVVCLLIIIIVPIVVVTTAAASTPYYTYSYNG